MQKQKIGKMIFIILAFMMLYMLMLAACNYYMVNKADDTADTLYYNYGRTQGDVAMGYAYFQGVKADLRNVLYLYAREEEKQSDSIEKIGTDIDNMNAGFDEAEDYLIDNDSKKILSEVRENVDLYISDVKQCLTYVSNGDIRAAREHLYNNGVASANAAADAIDELIENLGEHATDEVKAAKNLQLVSSIAIFIFLIMIFISTMGAARVLCKALRDPMVELSKVAEAIAVGDVEHNVERLEPTPNEAVILQNSFCNMIENLKLQASVINKLSEGNFNIEYKAASDKDIVGNAIERLIKDNNSAFRIIREAADQISMGSNQIAAASQILAQGSTEQADAIQQIAASITDIAGKTKENASQANEVKDIVDKTKSDVELGNERMQEMVASMEEINEASENIRRIIKVIDDIAFNTNILALNASVEAARAGEHGKGFAVVAEEVRSLAGRSAEASSQTTELIEDSISKVKKGSELAKETENSLTVISDMIDKITQLSAEIADASKNQATSTAQINKALEQVSQVVQTNSATSQECASASEELSGQARGLNKEIAKFKLKGSTMVKPSQMLKYDEPIQIGSRDIKY